MSIKKVDVAHFFEGKTATYTSEAQEPWFSNRSFELSGTTASGVGEATVIIEVRNSSNAAWQALATLVLSLSSTNSSVHSRSTEPWRQVRARLSAISGTTATVSCNLGAQPL